MTKHKKKHEHQNKQKNNKLTNNKWKEKIEYQQHKWTNRKNSTHEKHNIHSTTTMIQKQQTNNNKNNNKKHKWQKT